MKMSNIYDAVSNIMINASTYEALRSLIGSHNLRESKKALIEMISEARMEINLAKARIGNTADLESMLASLEEVEDMIA